MSEPEQALLESEVSADPIDQFRAWYDAAGAAGVQMPEAMALATATAAGVPSLRMVLLKGADRRGLVFFTNYESRKGRELAANPRAALLLYWQRLGRQVRAEGAVERVSADETAAYVRSRARGSQLSALASPQSEVVADRQALEQRKAQLAQRYGDGELPIPANWGGFRLVPETLEFWQDRRDRLHDRLRYRRDDAGGWVIERLAP